MSDILGLFFILMREGAMRWTLVAACAALAAGLWLPGEATQPASAAATAPATAGPTAAADQPINFAEYREWRLNFIKRRRTELAIQLEANDLPAATKSRLDRVKAYYDRFAALPEADRDSRFRQRFDRIDSDHDGTIDAAERAAWREQRRAFYRHDRALAPHAADAAATAH
jgi:hypothetical protein